MNRSRRPRSARTVPALYGALTSGLVAVVLVVASVVSPATPPSIAELSPSARERIEEARDEQGVGGHQGSGNCAPGDIACIESQGKRSGVGGGSKSGAPPSLEVAAGRRCFGNPPRQTEDPHSPPCVFEIFKGDNGGATAPGVSATEIRVAAPFSTPDSPLEDVFEALVEHFNRRYEFYGRRLTPIFVPGYPGDDAAANKAFAEELASHNPFAVISNYNWASNAVLFRQLGERRVLSVVATPPGFDSTAVPDGWTWSVDPPLDYRLRAGAAFVCRALNGRPARHAGEDVRTTTASRRFAVVVLTEPAASPDSGPLEEGLRGCDADFKVFEAPRGGSSNDYEALMLELKQGGFTTVLPVSSIVEAQLYHSASRVGYFPEWMDLGITLAHREAIWAGFGRPYTAGHATHAFGITADVRIRPDAEVPAMWALREGDPSVSATQISVEPWYESLLVLASGIQGAGPNLTRETFAQALRSTQFPNPNAGAPPHWQQDIGFSPVDFVFHDDYAVWWWSDAAPSQSTETDSGRGSFCYLDRGGRFTADTFPSNADARLFSSSEPCR